MTYLERREGKLSEGLMMIDLLTESETVVALSVIKSVFGHEAHLYGSRGDRLSLRTSYIVSPVKIVPMSDGLSHDRGEAHRGRALRSRDNICMLCRRCSSVSDSHRTPRLITNIHEFSAEKVE